MPERNPDGPEHPLIQAMKGYLYAPQQITMSPAFFK